MRKPASSLIIAKFGRNPYLILISCILSLRTRDTVSEPASCRLFEIADTPEKMLLLSPEKIQKLIYPVGFYRKKSETILRISKLLIDNFQGKVPAIFKDLISLPGVGLKTANLVLYEAFGIPAICVDTHVHRISNRLGLVKTKTAQETEMELKKIVPSDLWGEFGQLLVVWGQNICVPQTPFCSRCPLFDLCPRISVIHNR